MNVCAVVVTHNRRRLLSDCLDAVRAQTRAPDHVVVVDNASTDGTGALLAERHPWAEVLALPSNEGSAGGFRAGVLRALENRPDWLWLMDDDTIPSPEALERLLDRTAGDDGLPRPSLLASKVVWTDGRVHPMNTPDPDLRDLDGLVRGIERDVLAVRTSTFPSLLVSRGAVERHGPPRAGYFVWSDDVDFTARILRDEPGFYVPASVVEHRTATAHRAHQGGERFYFAVRNGLWLLRGDAFAPKEKVRHVLVVAEQVRLYLALERLRPRSLRVLVRGLRDGLLRPPP
jgi:GT2 family glycosyltransferase